MSKLKPEEDYPSTRLCGLRPMELGLESDLADFNAPEMSTNALSFVFSTPFMYGERAYAFPSKMEREWNL